MRDRFEGVAVFVASVEAGGFSRAAEQLALSRSAVGKAIARLEARLNVRLFHRTTRVQTLTEEGQAYYERCCRALEELRTGERLVEAGRTEVAGPLRVSVSPLFGRNCVTPVLLARARDHPLLELDMRFSDRVVDVIGEGFDLAIRHGELAESGGLRSRKLFSHRKIVCAAPVYLADREAPADITALSAHKALIYRRGGQPFPWQLRTADGELQDASLNFRLSFDDLEAILEAALAGMGIAFLPEWLIRGHLRAGHLIAMLQDYPSTLVDSFAVWPDTHHLPRRVRVAIDALAAFRPDELGIAARSRA